MKYLPTNIRKLKVTLGKTHLTNHNLRESTSWIGREKLKVKGDIKINKIMTQTGKLDILDKWGEWVVG